MATANDDMPAGGFVLPWRQQTLKAWKARASQAIIELRDMGLIEINRPLSDIRKELEAMMNDPALQTTKDLDEAETEATSDDEPAWTRLVPSWVLADHGAEDDSDDDDYVDEWGERRPEWFEEAGDREQDKDIDIAIELEAQREREEAEKARKMPKRIGEGATR